MTSDWIRGFTDGEGCFYVGINKNNTMTMMFQVLPEFVISQHNRDVKILYEIKEFFKCGLVKKNNKEVSCFSVRNLKHLNTIIIPFFEKNPLLTSKKFNFIKFRWIVKCMLERKYHLSSQGLEKIIKIKKRMNTQKINKIESSLFR